MAKFKCITSDDVYEFTMEHDIVAMRKHPEYVELVDEAEEKPARKTATRKGVKDEEADE